MKKLLLSLGALSAVVAPVAAVVACGSTDSDSTSFEIATDVQAIALHDLATTIQGHNSIIEDGATLTKTEVDGTTVRFTYTPSTDTSPRIVTVSLDSKKITKVENELNGDLHDNTNSITDLDSINQSMHADFIAAATAFETASEETAVVDLNSPKTQETKTHETTLQEKVDAEQKRVNSLSSTIAIKKVFLIGVGQPLTAEEAKTSFGIENFDPKSDFIYTYENTLKTITITVYSNTFIPAKITATPININISA